MIQPNIGLANARPTVPFLKEQPGGRAFASVLLDDSPAGTVAAAQSLFFTCFEDFSLASAVKSELAGQSGPG
jgi:hypothetical protein